MVSGVPEATYDLLYHTIAVDPQAGFLGNEPFKILPGRQDSGPCPWTLPTLLAAHAHSAPSDSVIMGIEHQGLSSTPALGATWLFTWG